MQAVVVTDPYLVAEVLGKDTEIEKSIEGVYSKFNVVRSNHLQLSTEDSSCFAHLQSKELFEVTKRG